MISITEQGYRWKFWLLMPDGTHHYTSWVKPETAVRYFKLNVITATRKPV